MVDVGVNIIYCILLVDHQNILEGNIHDLHGPVAVEDLCYNMIHCDRN